MATGAALLAFALAPESAHAYVVKKTTRGDLVHWDERAVDYTFDPSLDASVPDALGATERAMVSWSGTVGAPVLSGHASPTGAAAEKPGFDEKNGIFFMPHGYAPAGRALAITVLTYDNASGRILDADIILNGSYRFAVLRDAAELERTPQVEHGAGAGAHPTNTDGISHQEEVAVMGAVYDLHHVVAHELGHSLGMNDEERSDALMYRYSAPNDASMRAPASDDIAGLAELYSTKLEAAGNGCGSAAVAAKKPSVAASQLAMFATLGLLFFLVLRGRSDRRARFALVAAVALAAYGLLPSVSKDDAGLAAASSRVGGDARGRVLSTTTTLEEGLFKTTYQLATTACRAAACPKTARGVAWGGTMGDIRQEVGGQFAPRSGDDVDVSFTKLPSALAPLTMPLPAPSAAAASVRVLTHVR